MPLPDHLDIDVYLKQLHNDGFHGADENLLKAGEWVCGEQATGQGNGPGIIAYLKANGMTLQQASDFVVDTNVYLCRFLPHR
ncbi:DUF732 domain-containing protein [Mycobacterium sp. M23085]|uniref:DUF732 domain-containing protein n=1 Tax=Mycobacterium sp. M23085 TaxID=3378087 RepID=UPI003877CB12